jgi:hypothetical protein
MTHFLGELGSNYFWGKGIKSVDIKLPKLFNPVPIPQNGTRQTKPIVEK